MAERSEVGWVVLSVHVDFDSQRKTLHKQAHENFESISIAICSTTPQSAAQTAPQPLHGFHCVLRVPSVLQNAFKHKSWGAYNVSMLMDRGKSTLNVQVVTVKAFPSLGRWLRLALRGWVVLLIHVDIDIDWYMSCTTVLTPRLCRAPFILAPSGAHLPDNPDIPETPGNPDSKVVISKVDLKESSFRIDQKSNFLYKNRPMVYNISHRNKSNQGGLMNKKIAALMTAAALWTGATAYAESTTYSSFSSYSYSSVTNSDGRTVTTSSSSSGSYQMKTEGDTLTLSLESNHTTGYSWEIHGLDRSALQVKRTYIADKAPVSEEGEPMVGTGGRDVFTFKAWKPGTTTLTLSYEQPWKGGEKGEAYDLTITAGEDRTITGVSLSTHQEKDPDVSDRVIIVSLAQGTSTKTLKALAEKYDMDLIYDMKNLSMASFKLKTPLAPEDMPAFLKNLEKEEVILGAWPDRKMYLQDGTF